MAKDETKPETKAGNTIAGAKAPEPAKPVLAAVSRYQIPQKRFALAESTQNRHAVVLESGRKYEDVFEPAFWAHVASKLKVGDTIDVRNDEQTFFASLYVRDCDRLWAKVVEIHKREFEPFEQEQQIDGIQIEHKGPHLKFCVYRKSDSAMLQSGFMSRVDAMTWAVNNRRQTAA